MVPQGQGQVVDPPAGHPEGGGHVVDHPPGPLPRGQPLGQRGRSAPRRSPPATAAVGGAGQHQHHLAPQRVGRGPGHRLGRGCPARSPRGAWSARGPPPPAGPHRTPRPGRPRWPATRPGASNRTVVRGLGGQRRQALPPLPARSGQEPLEAEAVGGQPAGHQGGQHRRGAGDHGDRSARPRPRPPPPAAPGVGDPGHAGVADHGHRAARRPRPGPPRRSRSSSLCSCSDRSGAPVMPAWVKSLRECRVSSQ